jgi:hypothetical protein
LIRCLAERIWNIVSDNEVRIVELERLKAILARNDYPLDIVDKTIRNFLEIKKNPEKQDKLIKDKKRFLKLPYVSRRCEDFVFRLKGTVNDYYPQVDFNVAFQSPMTIGKMLPFKDNIKNIQERSLVVYSLKCDTCGAEYIGKTERILCHRIKVHMNNSSSALKQHLETNTDHHIDFENVKILDSAENDTKLRIKELLHILSRGPELNKQLGLQSS